MEQNLHSIVFKSLFWKFLERMSTQGVQFIVQVILARILSPKDFGTITILLIFINFGQVFVQSGFSMALIQKKDTDEIDFSSVFFVSLLISVIFYIIVFIISPWISNLYKDSQLIRLFRIISISVIFGSYNSIQYAYIVKKMQFKSLFICSFISSLIAGIIAIYFAFKNYGVWSLVILQIATQICLTLSMSIIVEWRPKLIFSMQRIKTLFSFGYRILISSLLNTIYLNLSTLLIGAYYSKSEVGFFNRAEQFPKVLVSNIDGTIQSVMLPTFSKFQNDKNFVKSLIRKSIMMSSFIVIPFMFGMAAVSEQMVIIVLTEKWISIVPILRLFCLYYAFLPIHTANLQAINAIGRSDIFLKVEIAKKILGVCILLLTLRNGLFAISLGLVISGVISALINSYPSTFLFEYSYMEQFSDIVLTLITSLLMGIIVYFIPVFINVKASLILILQIISGLFIYVVLNIIVKNPSYTILFQYFKRIRRK